MKRLIIFFMSILFFNISICSQLKYKEVKTGQDVIDNFVTSRGGKDILRKIKTIKLEAAYYNVNGIFSLTRYIGIDFYYQYWGNDDFKITTAFDDKNNSGWESDGSFAVDFTDELLKNYHNNSVNFWGNYINSKKSGITYMLKGKDTINNTEVYEVDLNIDLAYDKTLYFDTGTYDIIRRVTDKGFEMNFSDYKSAGNPSIPMPHLYFSSDTMKVISYEFNPEFDKNLLKKPKNK